MLIMKPCPGIRVQKIYIPSGARRIPALVLSPEELFCPGGGSAVDPRRRVHFRHEGDGVHLPRR